MKKFFAVLLCAMMACGTCGVALGEADEPMTLTFMLQEHEHSVLNNDVYTFKTLGEKFNVVFDFQLISGAAYNERVNMVLAGGEYPDVMYAVPDSMAQYYDTGIFVELTDIIPEKIPNFLTACEAADSNYLKNIKDDEGRMWYLTKIEYSNYNLFPYLNQDWLEEVGMEIPTSIDELYAVLTAFKELKGDDAIIWAAGPWTGNNLWSTVLEYFGSSSWWMHEELGTYVYGPYERADELKDALTFLNQCSNEGLLDPDWMTRDDDAINARINAGEVGFFITYGDNGNTWGPGGTSGTNYIITGPFTTENGDPFVQPNTLIGGYYYIMNNGDQEKLDKICEVMNYVYSDEGTMLFSFGEEGYTYTLDADGNPQFTDVVLKHELGGVNGRRQLGINPGPFPHVSLDTAWGQIVGEVSNEGLEKHKQYWKLSAPVLAPTVEESAEQTQLIADINKYFSSAVVQFITGDLSLEDDWDTYLSTMEELNVERYIEVCRGHYERWLAR